MEQIIILSITLVLLVIYFYSHYYRLRMPAKGDERWLEIEKRASRIANGYFQGLIVVVALAQGLLLFLPEMNVTISLERVLMIAFWVIIAGQVVEVLALRHFNRVM
ncbi:hypothetical protein ACYSNU_15485 [Enterococcus sp. LJL120]